MDIMWDQIIVWVIVGAIAGSLAGLVTTRKKKGYGHLANLGIGLIGALVGGFLFRLFNIDLGLGSISVSLEDIVAAFIGAMLLLLLLRLWKRRS